MTTTPAPGVLSARLLEMIADWEAEIKADQLVPEVDRDPHFVNIREHDIARMRAALSALPAAGGEDREWMDRWSDILPALAQNGGANNLRGSGAVIGNPETDPSDARLAPHLCKGTNCTASKENGYKHSSECLFEHARAVASGVKSAAFGVSLPDGVTYIEWRGKRIDLTTPQPSAAEKPRKQTTVHRSNATGRIVSKHYATTHPNAVSTQTVPAPLPPAERAAVGAQGDLADRIENIPVPTFGFHQGWRDEEIWEWALREAAKVARLAAPAAGKGVERIISEMRGEAYAFGSSWVSGRKLAEWANRLSALTRQPVAGESEALRAVLYRIAMGAEPAQKIANDALAATPTDGGEGKS